MSKGKIVIIGHPDSSLHNTLAERIKDIDGIEIVYSKDVPNFEVPCKVRDVISNIVYVEPKDLTKIQSTNYLPARKNRRERRKLNRNNG